MTTIQVLSPHKLERLGFFLKDDKQALAYCLDLLYIAHLWDDLIDGDKHPSLEAINQAFIKSLAAIPNNLFYRQWQPILLPMMHNAMVMWLEANDLRAGDPDQRTAAFTLENAVVGILHFCILVKGSTEWARLVGPEFWTLFGPTKAEFDECLTAAAPIDSEGEYAVH